MLWLSILLKLLIPLAIALYTINFGRWMGSRKKKSGAFGAYAIAVIAFGLSAYVLIKNSL